MVSPGELQVVTRLVADVADLDLTLHVPPGGAPLSRHHASSESPPGLCAGAMRLFRLAAAAQVVVVSKHLCGCATDFALRCVASSTPPRRLLLATCCHHRCTFADYAGRPFLLAVGVSREEFEARYTLRPSPPSGLLFRTTGPPTLASAPHCMACRLRPSAHRPCARSPAGRRSTSSKTSRSQSRPSPLHPTPFQRMATPGACRRCTSWPRDGDATPGRPPREADRQRERVQGQGTSTRKSTRAI